MQQNIGVYCPTVFDYSLKYRWESCRTIGIINKVYFELSMCLLIMKALAIANDCRVFKNDSACKNICANYNMLPVVTAGIYWIVNILVYALFHKLVFVNDGLRSTSIPTNQKKVKTWLLYHKGCLGICILFFIGLLIIDPSTNFYNLYYCTITCIGLITELKVVKKFNKEFEISAEHRNRGLQISNI